jgi:hypothetical protein
MATISPFSSAPAGGTGGTGGSAGGGTGGGSAGHGGGGAGGAAGGGTAGAGGSSAAGPITGSAVFTSTSTGVDVMITINGCVDTKSYPVHIHEGSSCTDVASQGPHWGAAAAAAGSGGSGGAGGAAGSAGKSGAGGTAGSGGAAGGPAMLLRGEGIPEIMCKGTTGSSMLSRANTDPKLAWSVGGDMTTNVVGHVVVVHDPVAKTPRIACGKITM